jgi:hypothetical protein
MQNIGLRSAKAVDSPGIPLQKLTVLLAEPEAYDTTHPLFAVTKQTPTLLVTLAYDSAA